MKVQFGNLPALGWDERAAKITELARLCEEVGFDRFGVADYRYYQDCFVVMTACLQATSRLEVASLVTDPYVRHPTLTAAAIATMEDLAPGRAILGIGGGLEQPAFWGETRPHPLQAVREAVDVCRRMWRGETVTHEGAVIKVRGAKLDFALETMPRVLVAARGSRMLRLAGEIADIVHLAAWFINVTHFRENVAEVNRGAERAGRRPDELEIEFSVPACVSRDRERARSSAKRFAARGILWMAAAERYSSGRTDWRPPREFDVPPSLVTRLAAEWDTWRDPDLPPDLAALIGDDLVDQFALAGEPAECAERMSRLVRERPEATAVRIQAYPPEGTSRFEGYRETVLGLRETIEAARRSAGVMPV